MLLLFSHESTTTEMIINKLPKYYYGIQLILTCISLFCKLHPLSHGPISNTAWSVPIARYCLPYQLCCAWQKE